MKKFILALSLGLLSSTSLMAAWCDSDSAVDGCHSSHWPSAFNFEAGVGYRQDKFKWSLSAGSEDDNVLLSQLRWKDLRIVQVDASASYVSCTNYAIRISGDYGHIYHGRNSDHDFIDLGGSEEVPFSISENNAGKGNVADLEGGIGYRVTSTCGRFVATPLIGYSYHQQHLHMYDGRQVLSLFSPTDVGPIAGLNSTYNTRWFGPWIGIDFTSHVEQCAYLFGSFEWHILSYRAEGRWNLRTDIGPFHQKAHGFGFIATLGANWEIWDNWSIGVMTTYRNFKTRHGSDRTRVIDPLLGEFTAETHFNGAKWHAFSFSGLVAYRF